MSASNVERPAHSPLGASGAERWMNCPGSVNLIKELTLPETDEPSYRAEGTAGHEAAAFCLEKGKDGWEIVGEEFYKLPIDIEMADAVQAYLDVVRPLMADADKVLVEAGISSDQHKLFYGTVDFAAVKNNTLYVVDLKMGKGVAVDVENNPQVMYYAYGILQKFPDVRIVNLCIVQPRGYHPDGPVRWWSISAEVLATWAHDVLFPSMKRTELDADLDAGKWCRFCPAKIVCPVMESLFAAAMQADPKKLVELTDAALGRAYQYKPAVESYIKALEEVTYGRLNTGHIVPGTKLVLKKANRVFKAEAEQVFREKYGDKAFDPPTMKSPAQMSEIDGEAAKLVKEYAYTPQTGLTVALEIDKRPAVKVESTTAIFEDAVKALDMNQTAG